MAFNTISGFFSAEGSSGLVSRLLGGLISELPNDYEMWLEAPSQFVQGQAIALITQIILNYTIN